MNTIKELKPVKDDLYANIAMNDLVMYSSYIVSQYKKEIIYEDIVFTSFSLFPNKFSLQGYDNFPDSAVILKRIVDIRHKNMISGSNAKGYRVTIKGKKIAEKIENILSGSISVPKPKATGRKDERTRARRFLKHIKQSQIFKKYKMSHDFENVSEYEFRSLLISTMESKPSVLRRNLDDLNEQMMILENNDMIQFLQLCKDEFDIILKNKYSANEQAGMIKKKRKK
jgi:hypothetical protein